MSDIIKIQSLIQKKKARSCQCKNRRFEVDPVNRTVTCIECGQFFDSIEALTIMCDKMSRQAEEINYLRDLKNELIAWLQKKRYFRVMKKIEEEYRGGNGVPQCPHCKLYFELSELKNWCDKPWHMQYNAAKKSQKANEHWQVVKSGIKRDEE